MNSLLLDAKVVPRSVTGNFPIKRVVTPKIVLPEEKRRYATIAAVIPAYNEEDTVAYTLQSLLDQTRPPDAVFVIVNNCSDETFVEAQKFAGVHSLMIRDQDHQCVVHVIDIGKNSDKKVGALNYGWELAKDFDYILGVDGDTTLDRKTVRLLEDEITSDARIGGISAIYSFNTPKTKDPLTRFLVTSQKFQFAAFNMDNLIRNRNMAVLGGQCSILSTAALRQVMKDYKQSSPWVVDSAVEDSLLSLQLKNSGFSTKISAKARAYVGPMETVASLHKQQIKWVAGAAELLLQQPTHPNLRLRWRENISMVFNIMTRLGFALLVAASLSINAFQFYTWWLVFPALAIVMNMRLAMSMHNRTIGDILYAGTLFLAEIYMLMRMSHFVSSWAKVLGKTETDLWGAQASAEQGKVSFDYLYPALITVGAVAGAVFWWMQLDTFVQTTILSFGWPILGVVTVLQGLTMLKRITRRQRGFKV